MENTIFVDDENISRVTHHEESEDYDDYTEKTFATPTFRDKPSTLPL